MMKLLMSIHFLLLPLKSTTILKSITLNPYMSAITNFRVKLNFTLAKWKQISNQFYPYLELN